MVAVYTNDFTGTSGNPPSDFTLSEVNGTGGTIDISGGNSLRLLTTATNFNTQRIILPSSNASFADGEVLVSYYPATGLGQMNLILRGSGSWASAGDSPTNGYVLILNHAGTNFFIYRYNSSTGTAVGTTQPYTWSTATWYFTRFAVGGATLKVKVWPHTSSEPAAWTYEVTDGTPYTTAGQFQLTFRTVSSAVRDMRLDSVGLTTPQAHASTATGTGAANNATTSSSGGSSSISAPATVAVSSGSAPFDGDNITSLTLEIYDPMTATGAAHDATVSAAGATSAAAAVASSAGVGNDSTVTRTGNADATVATAASAANAATVSTTTGTTNVAAGCATGEGSATGVTYLEDENGDPILDEFDQPIEDGYGLTITIALGSTISSSTGAGHTPQTAVAPNAGNALSVGSAPQPAVNTAGGSSTTNVNAASAASAGTADISATLVSPSAGSAGSVGAAETPSPSVQAPAGYGVGTGAAYDLDVVTVSVEATGLGEALNPQIDVVGQNFVTGAAIPISASAGTPNVFIYIYPDAITVASAAYAPNQATDTPGQLVTLRDAGHTVTVKER